MYLEDNLMHLFLSLLNNYRGSTERKLDTELLEGYCQMKRFRKAFVSGP